MREAGTAAKTSCLFPEIRQLRGRAVLSFCCYLLTNASFVHVTLDTELTWDLVLLSPALSPLLHLLD